MARKLEERYFWVFADRIYASSLSIYACGTERVERRSLRAVSKSFCAIPKKEARERERRRKLRHRVQSRDKELVNCICFESRRNGAKHVVNPRNRVTYVRAYVNSPYYAEMRDRRLLKRNSPVSGNISRDLINFLDALYETMRVWNNATTWYHSVFTILEQKSFNKKCDLTIFISFSFSN